MVLMLNSSSDPVFLFFGNNRYYIIEIKLAPHTCYYKEAAKSFVAAKPKPQIFDLQWGMILMGGGILVIVNEPPPLSVTDIPISDEQQEKCEALLNNYKILLGNNQIPYEVYVINQEKFTKFWRKYLETTNATVRERAHRKKIQVFRRLSWQALKELIPECIVRMTMQDFLKGRIVDEILLSLKS
jgi:hypothetical protein